MGTEKIIEQFKESQQLIDLIQVFLNEFDVISAEIVKINDQRSIDGAEGNQVKRNARLVGLSDLGFNDADFKEVTKIQIKINTSFGAPDRMMEIASELGEFINSESITAPLVVLLTEDFPAAIILDVTGLIDGKFVGFYRASLEKSKSGGVRLIINNRADSGVTHLDYNDAGADYNADQPYLLSVI